MSRWVLRTASMVMFIAGLGQNSLQAQQSGPYLPPNPEARPIPAPVMPGEGVQPANHQLAPAAYGAPVAAPSGFAAPQQAGYVRLNAPLYPSPKPNIPIWTGGTMITNQALAPHEMLYAHSYRAMYGPFYHRVHGGYFWTPFGMRSHERWDLLGTQVSVKYRSHWPVLGAHPPISNTWGGPWK